MHHVAADKKHNKIQASYTLGSTVHRHVKASNISVYLVVTITSDLKWNSQI